MDPPEEECGYVNSIGLPRDRDRLRALVTAAMILRVP